MALEVLQVLLKSHSKNNVYFEMILLNLKMKGTLLLIILFLILQSCNNKNEMNPDLKEIQGRYLFLEYYFKSPDGSGYAVDARGNKTYWIFRNDSIYEEYYIVKKNISNVKFDFVNKLKKADNSRYFFDTIPSTFSIAKDTLRIENQSFRYTLYKENDL